MKNVLPEDILKRFKEVPIYKAMGFEPLEYEKGRCLFRVPRNRDWDGVFQSFHGGLLMTVADSIACIAVFSETGADEIVTTTDMNIRFLAPCLTDVIAEARMIKVGRTMCPVAVSMEDTAGKQVAIAQINYMRLPNYKKSR